MFGGWWVECVVVVLVVDQCFVFFFDLVLFGYGQVVVFGYVVVGGVFVFVDLVVVVMVMCYQGVDVFLFVEDFGL